MNATGWSRGLEALAAARGSCRMRGWVLLRQLSDRMGLTSVSAARPSPLGGHDRGRVFADLACAIADGARVISDFRVMGDARQLFGLVASVPAAWRALSEMASRGDRWRRKVTAAEDKARRHAWARGIARHGTLPNFKGFGHHPLAAECGNVAEPLAWMLRPGSAGSNRPSVTCGCWRRRSPRCRRRCAAT